jgi:hypothetical protein
LTAVNRGPTLISPMAEIKKSFGTYMSVDAAEAVEHNRAVIDQIRELVQHAAAQKHADRVNPIRLGAGRSQLRFLAHQGKRYRELTMKRHHEEPLKAAQDL